MRFVGIAANCFEGGTIRFLLEHFTIDSSSQEYILVADDTDNVIRTLGRSDGTVMGMFGHNGRNVGQFHAIHQLASDSSGNLYEGEVETGKRVPKFVLVGGK